MEIDMRYLLLYKRKYFCDKVQIKFMFNFLKLIGGVYDVFIDVDGDEVFQEVIDGDDDVLLIYEEDDDQNVINLDDIFEIDEIIINLVSINWRVKRCR